jgi:hypothetical protein
MSPDARGITGFYCIGMSGRGGVAVLVLFFIYVSKL